MNDHQMRLILVGISEVLKAILEEENVEMKALETLQEDPRMS